LFPKKTSRSWLARMSSGSAFHAAGWSSVRKGALAELSSRYRTCYRFNIFHIISFIINIVVKLRYVISLIKFLLDLIGLDCTAVFDTIHCYRIVSAHERIVNTVAVIRSKSQVHSRACINYTGEISNRGGCYCQRRLYSFLVTLILIIYFSVQHLSRTFRSRVAFCI